MKYNLYYLDTTYTMPAHGINPEVVVERPNRSMIVESNIPEEKLQSREWWWSDTFKNGRFATAVVGSRVDILMSMGNVEV